MADQHHLLSRDIVHYHLGADLAPRLTVEPGSTVVVETHDARSGQLRRPEDVIPTAPDFSAPGHPKTNPVTGPIAVRGAEPGDAVVVTIDAIALDAEGFIIARPEWGTVRNSVPRMVARMLPIEDGAVVFSERLRIPVVPNIGTIGLAPAGKGISTIWCGDHGGNMDCNAVAVGASVHLPVRQRGGLLFVGDLHAVMADAEPVGTGCEIGGRVTLTLGLEKGGARDWPWIETQNLLVSYGAAPRFEDAAAIAMEAMIDIVAARHDLSRPDAFMLIGLAGHVRLNQACRSQIDISVRVEFPKHLGADGRARPSSG